MTDMDLTFDLIPEGGANSFHLLNDDDEVFRTIWAQTTNNEAPLSVRVKLAEVHHGRMVHESKSYEATLLVFEIRFESVLQERRYKSAQVTFEFFDKEGKARRDPHVVKLAPENMHWLNKTTKDKTSSRETTVGARVGPEIAGAEANTRWTVEYTEPKKFKATLAGKPHFSKGRLYHQNHNAVTWTMQENQNEQDGIPSFLQTAVLLKRSHSGPFYAKLRIKSSVDFVARLRRAFPFTTDQDRRIDPVVFTPGSVQMRNSSITGMTDADLNHMHDLPLPNYFKVSLSEEDSLTPPIADRPSHTGVVQLPQQDPSAAKSTVSQASIPSEEHLEEKQPAPESAADRDSASGISAPDPGASTEKVKEVKALGLPSSTLTSLSAVGQSVAEAANKAAEAARAAAQAASAAVEAANRARVAAETAALAAAEAALIAVDAERVGARIRD
ncbi:uncharacterized protein EI97DRAFT_458927 [Westerdykella ornata]|uniref:Uncharacterized protein n=1 Tax=Westerdykella ornata TaxID=318751 RepID=A0A6A6JLZ2_WESOR|nr:uncharacterized protein EI97DRAFT_458927 [Westerdykella ornata]KAF2275929.1 hypothetical protein EI97DRAFT_458927 [Westerdykella ornata]